MTPRERIGRLCVITDLTVQSRFTHEELARLAVEGGADMIQLRDKQMTDPELIETARRMRDICGPAGATLIVNDRVEVALLAGADGVHVGRGDTSVIDARAALGDDFIVGATAGSLGDAKGVNVLADYIGFGHVFPTTSKLKPGPPVGLDGLAAICRRVSVPVLAIGGITADTARSCIDAGAHGVAVIAAVCAADDPRAAARALRAAIGA